MTMEQVVRPFQLPNRINDKKTITILPKIAKTNAALEWGQAGAPPTITGLNFNTKKEDKIYKEDASKRQSTDIRVENPDDPNQYIMEKRIDSMQFSVKDMLPSSALTGNSSGSSGGAMNQISYAQNEDANRRLQTYNKLLEQGISPGVASTMAYGDTFNSGPLPQEDGPDSRATYELAKSEQ